MTHTTQTTQITAVYVGIDGSQKTLTIAIYPTDEVGTISNTCDHRTTLVQRLAHLPIQRVLLESSGGYKKAVVAALQQAGLPVVVVPAQCARYFAKSMRGDLKTDRADARMLAYFACCYPVQSVAPCAPVQAELKELGRVASSWCNRWSAKRSVCRPCSLRQCERRWSGCLSCSKKRSTRLRRGWKS